MPRTTDVLVKGVLLDNYGPRADGTLPDLAPFIAAASSLVDQVAACATRKSITLTTPELELIERWLASHFYQHGPDMGYTSKSTMGASASFQGQTGLALDGTYYGQMAKLLDKSGCLNSIASGRPNARGVWLGKRPSEQIPADQRD